MPGWHIAEDRWIWPPCPGAREETGSGCMKGVSGAPSSAHLMHSGAVAVGAEPVLSRAGCLLYPQVIAACPSVHLSPSLGWQRLWMGGFVMLGHPRAAGSHSDPCGFQGLLRDGLGGSASPPKPAPHHIPACQEKQQAGTLPGLPCPHHPWQWGSQEPGCTEGTWESPAVPRHDSRPQKPHPRAPG